MNIIRVSLVICTPAFNHDIGSAAHFEVSEILFFTESPMYKKKWRKNWRGLWIWPPWVICAPVYNHKPKKFCTFRGFLKLFSLELDNEKATPWTIAAQKCSTDEPIENGRPIDPITNWCGLALFCISFSCAENFVILFYEIKLLLTYWLWRLFSEKKCFEDHQWCSNSR